MEQRVRGQHMHFLDNEESEPLPAEYAERKKLDPFPECPYAIPDLTKIAYMSEDYVNGVAYTIKMHLKEQCSDKDGNPVTWEYESEKIISASFSVKLACLRRVWFCVRALRSWRGQIVRTDPFAK